MRLSRFCCAVFCAHRPLRQCAPSLPPHPLFLAPPPPAMAAIATSAPARAKARGRRLAAPGAARYFGGAVTAGTGNAAPARLCPRAAARPSRTPGVQPGRRPELRAAGCRHTVDTLAESAALATGYGSCWTNLTPASASPRAASTGHGFSRPRESPRSSN